MGWSILAIQHGSVERHANLMKGLMVGAIAAGTAALAPGRFLAGILG